jgi:NHL repeat
MRTLYSSNFRIGTRTSSAALILLFTLPHAVHAQYTISTIAKSTSSTVFNGYGVGVDGSGNVYATGQMAAGPVILQVNSGSGTRVAGGGGSFPGCGSASLNALFTDLGALNVDSSGTLYIAESGNAPILAIRGGVVTCLTGSYYFAAGVAPDGNGGAYFSTGESWVYHVTSAGTTTISGASQGGCAGGEIGSAQGLALDSSANLYIADRNCNMIWKFSSSSGLSAFAGNGMQGFSGENVAPTQASLNEPESVAVDLAGNVYIADWGNNRVRMVHNGKILTIAGSGMPGYLDANPPTNAELNGPYSIAVAPNGTVYFGEQYNQDIRQITPTVATMISPANGATLSSPSTTFTWTSVPDADQYRLTVGSAPGGNDYFDNLNSQSASTEATVNLIPCDGRRVYVQLITKLFGDWLPAQSYQYSAPAGCASITSPANGSRLPGSLVTFRWAGGAPDSQYEIDISDKVGPLGQGDIFTGLTSSTFLTLSNMPADGRTIYVQLATSGHPAGRYTYQAWKTVTIVVSPSSLPQQGGTISVTVTVNPGTAAGVVTNQLAVTETAFPFVPVCTRNPFTGVTTCTEPTSIGSRSLTLTPQTAQTVTFQLTIAALPASYQNAVSSVFTAALTTSAGAQIDAATATFTHY